MTEKDLAHLYAEQLGVTPRLEFDTKQVKEILGVGDTALRRLKKSVLQYSRRGEKHVFYVLDIYKAQQAQRDKQTFNLDQVAA